MRDERTSDLTHCVAATQPGAERATYLCKAALGTASGTTKALRVMMWREACSLVVDKYPFVTESTRSAENQTRLLLMATKTFVLCLQKLFSHPNVCFFEKMRQCTQLYVDPKHPFR